MKYLKHLLSATILLLASFGANAQLIYGNTFPFWTVTGNTTSGSLVVTGTSTFTGGIVGVATAGLATTGNVGEYVTATVATGGAVVTASTGVSVNITSISLTAGDWDVTGVCDNVGSSLIVTVFNCGISTTSATLLGQAGTTGVGTDPTTTETYASSTLPNATVRAVRVGPVRVSIAATTTVYLVVNNTFSGGTFQAFGTIQARRMR